MGHRHSRPVIPIYQKVESMFEDIGCSGFTDDDYYGYDRLEQAPFLNYKLRSANYAELKQQITDIFANLPDALANSDLNSTNISFGGSQMGSTNMNANLNIGDFNINSFNKKPDVNKNASNGYSSQKDYVLRITDLLDDFLKKKLISIEDKQKYLNKLLDIQKANGPGSGSDNISFQKALFDLNIPGVQLPYYSTNVSPSGPNNIKDGSNFIDSYSIDNIIGTLTKQYNATASGSVKDKLYSDIINIKNKGEIKETFSNAKTININQIVNDIRNASGSPPYMNPLPNGGDPVKKIFGPVYLLSAYDLENKVIESWLYFPSLTPERKLYPNFWFLANSNKWLFRILYSVMYKVKPYSSCNMRQMIPNEYDNTSDPAHRWFKSLNASFIQGCKSIDKDLCKQSENIHRAMGIYDDKKNSSGYPSAYFRTYKINGNDPTFSQYFDKNSFNNLLMCFLSSDTEIFAGCRYMLVSPNRKFFYILESDKLVLYYNFYTNIDIMSYCHQGGNPRVYAIKLRIINFGGVTNTKLVFEQGYLNIYSQLSDDDPEALVWSMLAVNESSSDQQCTIILLDNGKLKAYDNNNKDVSNKNLDKLGSILKGDEIDVKEDDLNLYKGVYNKDTDFKLRLIQLAAYLKIRNMIKNGTISSADEYLNFGKGSISGSGKEYNPKYDTNIGKYSSKVDYIDRITILIDTYINNNKMTSDDKEYYLKNILSNKKYSNDNIGSASSKIGTFSDIDLMQSLYSEINRITDTSNGSGSSKYAGAGSLGDELINTDNEGNYNDGNGPNMTSQGSTLDDNYNDIDKGYDNAKASIDKQKKDRDDAQDKVQNNEFSLLTGIASGSGSNDEDGLSNQQTSYSILSKMFGIDVNDSGIIESKPDSDQSFVMGFNPPTTIEYDNEGNPIDNYNDELTPEEINYLLSNGIFDHIKDIHIRIKMLHQFYKKNHKKLYYSQ